MGSVFNSEIMLGSCRYCEETYNSHANPRLSQIDQQRVLGPALGGLDFLEREIGAVLLEMNLDNQGDTAYIGNSRSV